MSATARRAAAAGSWARRRRHEPLLPDRPAASEAPFEPRLGASGRLAVLGVWTFLGLLESSKAYFTMRLGGQPVGIRRILIGNMPWWYVWALLTPIALAVGRRFPLGARAGWRNVGAHLLAAAVLSGTHLVVTGTLYWHTHTRFVPGIPDPLTQVRRFFDNYLFLDLLTYAAIIGALFAFAYHHRYQEREMAAARLRVRAADLEATMNRAQLDALRMELNPHFLFNTLNAISGLVRGGDNDAAVTMLARLGELLRATLERGTAHEIPLETELAYLRGYLEIEQVRFRDRLHVDVRIDEAALPALVPAMILQPLVENAVRHGIAPLPGPGRVAITASRRNGDLVLVVEDSGRGTRGTAGNGVGLSNTRSRLERLYGPRARLQFRSAPEGGAAVSVVMPFRIEPEDGDG